MDPAGVDAPSRYDMDEIKRSEENPPPKTQRLRHNLSRLEAIWRHYKKRFWRRSKQFLAFRVTLPPATGMLAVDRIPLLREVQKETR